jgi:hypothetical protein
MKIGSLFDVVRRANDLCEYFDGVDNSEQMVSRLERLKKAAPSDLTDDIKALRDSVSALLDDTMEMGRSVDDTDEDELDNELSDLGDDDGSFENFLAGSSEQEPATENEKKDTKADDEKTQS